MTVVLLLGTGTLVAQEVQAQPLSRNDKAIIEQHLADFKEAESRQSWNIASESYNKIAFLYWEHNDYRKAIEYYEQSLELNKQVNNENGLAMLHNNLGMLYADIRDYERSLTYLNLTLAARRAMKSKEGMIAALKNMSVSLNNLGRNADAISSLQEALTKAQELGDANEMASCYLMLSETYQKGGDIANTTKYFELYQDFIDYKSKKNIKALTQLANEEELKNEIAEFKAQIQEQQLNALQSELNTTADKFKQFDEEKVRMTQTMGDNLRQIQYLQMDKENTKLRNEEELRQQKALRNSFLIGALGLLGVSFFIYRNYRQEQRSKLALAEKNEKINFQNTELESLNTIIAKHNKRMQSELDVGREIQMSMIPSGFPEVQGVDLFAALEPALEVGGDLYDFFRLDEDHLMFGIGDVSDKGVPAALFMAVTQTLVKTNANYSSLPGMILTQVNKDLSTDNESAMFVTYFLSVLNTKTGELTYCNAGHNPPLYLSRNGKVSKRGVLNKLNTVHGPVLGAVEDYEYKQDTLIMKKGEQLVLFTDGVTEAMNAEQKQYSNERLDSLMSNNGTHDSKASVEEIIADVIRFRGEADQSDDLTIMSLIYTGV